METENNMIVETLLELSDASDEHMEEVLSDIPIFTERDMLSEWDGLPVKHRQISAWREGKTGGKRLFLRKARKRESRTEARHRGSSFPSPI